jgi:hypothetical protein
LGLHVVVGDGSSFGILLCERFVGGIGSDGDDVPGVEEAGEIGETCVGDCQRD